MFENVAFMFEHVTNGMSCTVIRLGFHHPRKKERKSKEAKRKKEREERKVVVWASKLLWPYETLDHVCKTKGQDSMYSFTVATTGFGGVECRDLFLEFMINLPLI